MLEAISIVASCAKPLVGWRRRRLLPDDGFPRLQGGSNGLALDTPEKRRACREAWRRFLAENRDKLKHKRPFSLLDPIPKEELFPGYGFSMPCAKRKK